ncbi:winged helix-turn-helix domain-containing protein [Phenylobacterium sp. LjRoot219]|uniref:TPR end-of-group domain-containing protein n=1 Tax=Phenylobacterium sp. LjRoot219 TaxID=3342283 RepID=UPI003ED0C86B
MGASHEILEARRIDLASEPPLAIGELRLEPRLRRIVDAAGHEELLEPRVMQVLVALVRAQGGVVSRDELLQSCWNGAIVGEDAIERVLGRIRRLTQRFAGLRLETVTKVGYRLLADAPAASLTAETPATARQPSVVVLPFLNMSDDPQQTYFSDGMTEDVITDLSKVSALSVLARTTSFSLREVATPVPELAERLGVTHVLEGSVRKAGGRVRVTAQLVDGASGTHLWAERYDRASSDVFALQDELTGAIVEALRLRLLPEERQAIVQRRTHNPDAYELYLMARRYYEGGGIDSGELRQLEVIERLCRRAVDLDPEFAQAWSLMAVSQTALLCHLSAPGDGGRAAIERALALDPDQAEPHAISARYLLQDGRMDEACAELDIALRLDPDSALVHAVTGRFHYVQREFAKSVPHLEYSTNASEIWAAEAGLLLSSYNALGDVPGMRATAQKIWARAEKVLARDYVNLGGIGCGVSALAALGEVERARTLVDRALLIAPDNGRMLYNFACGLSAFVGDHDGALKLLEPVFKECSVGLLRHVAHDPDLDAIRKDPRFIAMIEAAATRLGLEELPS